jgi:hypothetical protein
VEIVLGGYFETALVHYSDAIIRPERNETSHPYYVCLNRKVPKAYFDRAATFIALAERIIVPSIDWAMATGASDVSELRAENLGIEINGPEQFGGREWDDDSLAFAEIVLTKDVLSPASVVHVSTFSLEHIDFAKSRQGKRGKIELRHTASRHYLCRLFLHLRAARDARALLVLSEPDIQVIKEVGEFLLKSKLATPFDFPDLTGQVVNGEDFGSGVLNFTPPDALALIAVKNDATVKTYSSRVSSVLANAASPKSQAAMLSAMRDAHDTAIAARRVEKVFEIASWVVKPLHYVPAVGEALTLAEDVKDVVSKWVDRDADAKEWYLLGAKMQEISIKDFLARKGNLIT